MMGSMSQGTGEEETEGEGGQEFTYNGKKLLSWILLDNKLQKP